MNADQIKQRWTIDQYLAKEGWQPPKQYGKYLMFKAEYRNEKTASLKLDETKTLCFDHGDTSWNGGSIIDLCMRQYGFGVGEAMDYIVKRMGGNSLLPWREITQPKQVPEAPVESTGHIIKGEPKPFYAQTGRGKDRRLTKLGEYLWSRKIDPVIAEPYLKVIHFSPRNNPEKNWSGIGFPNQSGGFEIRAPFKKDQPAFKTCTAPKDISYVQAVKPSERRIVNVFEGFTDFLTFLTLYGLKEDQHALVMNGVSLAKRARNFILVEGFDMVMLWSQNNAAAQKADDLFFELEMPVESMKSVWEGFDDLNDFACGTDPWAKCIVGPRLEGSEGSSLGNAYRSRGLFGWMRRKL